jgi:phosphatidylinositol alpha-1,6-mannosyltransferase
MIRRVQIVGLFPSLDSGSIGGVQASGREAWSGIVAQVGDQRTRALCYERGRSRAKAVLRAIGTRRQAETVLVWHLHLLKLLPLLGYSRARVVLFLHGIESWFEQDRFTQLLLKKVDLFLTNSDYTWTRFLETNPAFRGAPHTTLALGLGSRLAKAATEPVATPAALMVGRLDQREDYKGHRQMIDAWPAVLQRISDAQLWIAGDGDLRPDLEALARNNGVHRSVRFFGQVSGVQKEQLIAQSRCMALPSKGEGFGLVYLEGMRMGRPCLVSNADAGREVVNPPEAGLMVNPDEPNDLAHAVQRLLTPGLEWDNWSQRARARYESRFTGEHFRQKLNHALFESEVWLQPRGFTPLEPP